MTDANATLRLNVTGGPEAADEIGRVDKALKATATAAAQADRASKALTQTGLNLSRQFADVGVSLAGGISPMMVLIQQGPQVADAFAMAKSQGLGFGAVLKGLLAAAAPLIPLLVTVAAAGGGFLIWKKYADDAKTAVDLLAKSSKSFVEGQDKVSGALATAVKFADQYKVANTSISRALDGVLVSQNAAYAATLSGIGATDAAGRAAVQRAELERLATVAILRRAAAEAQARAQISDSAVKAAKKSAFNTGLLSAIGTGDLSFGQEVQAAKFKAIGGNAAAAAAAKEREYAATLKASADALMSAKLVIPEHTKVLDHSTTRVGVHTKALKAELETVELLTVDMKTLVDLTDVLAAKPFKAEGLVPTSESTGKFFAEQRREIDGLSGYLEDQFVRSGRLAFGDIADYAKEELRRAVFKALLSDPIRIIVDAVVRGLPAGGTGLASLGTAQGVAGLAAVGGSLIGGRGGNAVASGAGIASVGLGLGSGLAGATATGALAGLGGLTAGLAALAPLLGPIAIVAGLAIALKGVLGPKPTNAGAGIALNPDSLGALSGGKRTAETEKAATAAGQAILDGQALLKASGITLATTVSGLVVGTRDLSQVYLSNGRTLTAAVGDATAAAEAGLKAVLDGATFASDAQKSLVQGMLAAGKGFDDITAALQGYAAAQTITQQIETAILQIVDPKAYAIDELKTAQKAQRDGLKAAADAGYLTAEQFAAAGVSLGKLEGLQLDETLKRFGEAVDDSTEALKAQAADLGKSVSDRILELTDPNGFKIKSINDRADAQAGEARGLIARGLLDAGILGQIETLRGLELNSLFAELAANVNESARAFAEARPRLLSWLDGLKVGPSAELSPRAQREEALRQYESQLAKARAGDAGALNDITGYAERLIQADRTATSSAGSRAALRGRISGEIEGLAGQGGQSLTPTTILAALQSPLATIAQASAADLAAASSGGKPVQISNLPAMTATYGAAMTLQTDRLVAANDQSREAIVAQLQVLATQLEAAIGALSQALAAGQAASADVTLAAFEQVRAGFAALETEQRLADARARQVA